MSQCPNSLRPQSKTTLNAIPMLIRLLKVKLVHTITLPESPFIEGLLVVTPLVITLLTVRTLSVKILEVKIPCIYDPHQYNPCIKDLVLRDLVQRPVNVRLLDVRHLPVKVLEVRPQVLTVLNAKTQVVRALV